MGDATEIRAPEVDEIAKIIDPEAFRQHKVTKRQDRSAWENEHSRLMAKARTTARKKAREILRHIERMR